MQADLLAQRTLAKISFEDNELPPELTPEKYYGLFKLIYTTIRIDLWLNVSEEKERTGIDDLSVETLDQLENASWDKFDHVRAEIYSRVMHKPDIEDGDGSLEV